MSELLLKLATKIYNKSEDELKPLIFDGEGKEIDAAFENLLALDTARVKRFRDKETEQFNAGHKKAKSEVAGDIEKYLKTELGLEVDGNYEVIAGAIKEQMASSKAKGKEITPDDIKKHPFFLDYEKNVIPKEKYETVTQEFEGYKTKVARDQKFSHVKNHAKKALETFQPDFSYYTDKPEIKNKLVDLYVSEFDELEDVELDNDGNVIAMVKDGKRLEDEHMNVIKFNDYAKKKASNYFKFLVQGAKGGAGNGKQPGSNSGGNGSFFAGMSREDATKHYNEVRKKVLETPGADRSELVKMAQELQGMQN